MSIKFSDSLKASHMKILADHIQQSGLNSLNLDTVSYIPDTLNPGETYNLDLSVHGLALQVKASSQELISTNKSLEKLLTDKLVKEMEKQMASINLKPIRITESTDYIDSTSISQDTIRSYPTWNSTFSASTMLNMNDYLNTPSSVSTGTIKLYPGPRPEVGVTFVNTEPINIPPLYHPEYEVIYRGVGTATHSEKRVALTPEYLNDLIEMEKQTIKKDLLGNDMVRETVLKALNKIEDIKDSDIFESIDKPSNPDKKPPAAPSPQLELF